MSEVERHEMARVKRLENGDPTIRRILVRATNPEGRTIEVAVLRSDLDIVVETAVWPPTANA